MKFTAGIADETYKLLYGNDRFFNPASIADFNRTINLTAGQNDTAAFQIVLTSDEAAALSLDSSLWVSQTIKPTVRISVGGPFKATMRHIGLIPNDERFEVADILLSQPVTEIEAGRAYSVWVELATADAVPGSYEIPIRITSAGLLGDETVLDELSVSLEVIGCRMPDPADYRFYLDLWQHLSNIARKHETVLWSDEHFAVLEQYVRSLAALGQKTVTLIASEIPWYGQGCHLEHRVKANLYEYSMIAVTRRKDGSLSCDFSAMQRYIDLCARYGIAKELSVFGLTNVWGVDTAAPVVPDNKDAIRVRYYDEADGLYKFMHTQEEIDAYIAAIEQYFVRTGQISRVRIVADEPGDQDAYRKELEHIHAVAPGFLFKAALNHASFIGQFGEQISDFVPYIGCLCKEYDTIKEYQRTMPGKHFLWYVCCGPWFPNTFLCCDLTQAYALGVLTSMAGLEGLLRWSYTTWTDDPRSDIRFNKWDAGDICLVYPAANGAPLLSLRYKALKRGIELFELLERLKEKDPAAADKAFDLVIREKDVRKYYEEKNGTEICSVDYSDYTALKRYLLKTLAD